MTRPLGCAEVREGIPGHVRGEGDAAERAGVEAHLAACEACRDEAAEAGRVRGLLAAARLDPEPRAGGWAELRARAAGTGQARRGRAWSLPVAAAAALLFVTAGLWVSMRRPPGSFGQVLVAAEGPGAEPVGALVTADAVRTGPTAGPTIALTPSVTVAFAPRTEATLLGGASLRLDQGTVAVTETQGSLSCQVQTPYGLVICFGTAFRVSVAPGLGGAGPSTEVQVFSGRVRMEGGDGRASRTIGAGESYVFDDDGIGVWVETGLGPSVRGWIPAATWAPRAVATPAPSSAPAGTPPSVRFLLVNPGPGLLALAPPNPRDPLFSATIQALDAAGGESKVHLQRVTVREVGLAAGPVRLLGPGESWDLLVDVGPGITKPGRYNVVVRYSAPAGAVPGVFVGSVESEPLALEVK
ncbi:MAG: zf-HC2 domain-containing protein [Planctomycetales bacterium]|nr:zf-HC2 domain-containing protein [Planctomycetales bacterium]